MTQHVVYSNATGSTQDLSDLNAIRLPGVSLTTNAEEGSVAISELVVDDVGGTLDLVGHRRIYTYESAESPGQQVIWNGYLGDRKLGRRPGQRPDNDEFILASDRRWTCSMVDHNSVLSRRVMNGSDCNRPAETDVARVRWLLTTTELNTVDDDLYVSSVDPVAMDAADYRGQRPVDILRSCAQHTGKNYFVWYREATGQLSLFYDYASSPVFDASISISNVRADIDNDTVFAPLPDAVLTIDPSRVQSGAYLDWDGVDSPLYVQSTATGNTFVFRDAAISAPDVKTYAKARARAERYLADNDTEDERITCSIVVPKERVNHALAGQRITVRFSHWPGYESDRWTRILRRTVTQLSDETYRLDFELDSLGCTASLVQSAYIGPSAGEPGAELAAPVTAGNLLVFAHAHTTPFGMVGPWFAPTNVSMGFTQAGSTLTPFGYNNNAAALWWKIADGTEGSAFANDDGGADGHAYWIAEFSTGDCSATFETSSVIDDQISNVGQGNPIPVSSTITPGTGTRLLIAFMVASNGNTPATGAWSNLAAGWTALGDAYGVGSGAAGTGHPRGYLAYRVVDNATGAAYPVSANVIAGFGGTDDDFWGVIMASFAL